MEASTVQSETALRQAWQANIWFQRNYLWSRPGRAIMRTSLGMSVPFGNGQVPV